MKPGAVVRIVQGPGTNRTYVGRYALVIRIIPQEEIRLRKGFPCGKWFEIFVSGDLKQVKQDCMEML